MFKPLYEEIETKIKGREEEDGLQEGTFVTIADSITKNIKQPLRPYQEKALKNFIYYTESNKKYKAIKNKHLLFQMATGSGKTNIVASTILYLYEKGYRDFIFFVNTTNIITKTKDNLANSGAYKYLFKKKIVINNKEVKINAIDESFEDSKDNHINIMFTTIQKLHSNLATTIKENSITYADFKDKKIVLIADEAHHLNSELKKTKNRTDEENIAGWGMTSKTLLNTHKDNILLEFTATAEIGSNKEIAEYYASKLIYNYSFELFRRDGYSKEVSLIRSGFSEKLRILQTIMISEYRLLIAQGSEINIALKPVILFKNPKGIKAVDKSLDNFNRLIENLSVSDIDEVFKESDILAISELHERVKDKKQSFVNQLKHSFRENVCVKIYSTSADKEETLNLLNSLEDEHNNIRVIFAVNVLNEGWDVLNLFDVVKLDEAKTSGASTTSEAQLIGRGARYFPFEYKEKDRYKRKFEYSDPLRMMEAMYFHSVNDNKYIEKLETTLNDMGILDKQKENFTYEFVPKEEFKNHHLYVEGVVYENSRKKIDKKRFVTGIDFYTKNYKRVQITYDNETLETKLLEKIDDVKYLKSVEYKLKEFDSDLVRSAINKKEFFYFKNLKKMFPNLKSVKEFITNGNYMGSIVFYVQSIKEMKIENQQKREMVLKALDFLEQMIIKNNREYIALQEFKAIPIRERISLEPKDIKYSLNADGSEPPLINYDDKEWYVYKQHRATSEEKDFVDFVSDNISKLKDNYSDIKLLRNEKAFNLFSMDSEKEANKFEPDFILLLEDKNNSKCYHQVFIEPKGNWAKGNADSFDKSHEKWKQDILIKITELTKSKNMKLIDINDNFDTTFYENPCYKVLGMPFWNTDTQDVFIDEFDRLLLGSAL